MGLSKVSKICNACEHYDDCDNKRMEACAYLIPKESLANPCIQQSIEPIAADMAVKHAYRNIKIAENTTVTIDLEEIKKKVREDFYKNLGCGFLSEG
jgi:hypothetical protein|nr:MAG TPA: hypothetical protein [Caudoviricetes sp.]